MELWGQGSQGFRWKLPCLLALASLFGFYLVRLPTDLVYNFQFLNAVPCQNQQGHEGAHPMEFFFVSYSALLEFLGTIYGS